MKKVITVVMTVVFCLIVTTSTFAAGTCNDPHTVLYGVGHCNGNGVNIRTGPGMNYGSVGYAYKNDQYHFYETVGETNGTQNQDFLWNHVHGEHIGWMYNTYFTMDDVARTQWISLERT